MTNENATCPSKIKDKLQRQKSYDSLRQNVVDNKTIDSDLRSLINTAENLLELLAQNEAKCHRASKNKYDNYHLNRIINKKKSQKQKRNRKRSCSTTASASVQEDLIQVKIIPG